MITFFLDIVRDFNIYFLLFNMANVHTLQDISSNKGYRLGSMREQELEETLHRSLKSISELNDCNKALQSKYLKRMKAFD